MGANVCVEVGSGAAEGAGGMSSRGDVSAYHDMLGRERTHAHDTIPRAAGAHAERLGTRGLNAQLDAEAVAPPAQLLAEAPGGEEAQQREDAAEERDAVLVRRRGGQIGVELAAGDEGERPGLEDDRARGGLNADARCILRGVDKRLVRRRRDGEQDLELEWRGVRGNGYGLVALAVFAREDLRVGEVEIELNKGQAGDKTRR